MNSAERQLLLDTAEILASIIKSGFFRPSDVKKLEASIDAVKKSNEPTAVPPEEKQ